MQIYHKLGNVSEAIFNYNIAIDLDPKEAAGLKVGLFVGLLVLLNNRLLHAFFRLPWTACSANC